MQTQPRLKVRLCTTHNQLNRLGRFEPGLEARSLMKKLIRHFRCQEWECFAYHDRNQSRKKV
jgi:hypothetical protein